MASQLLAGLSEIYTDAPARIIEPNGAPLWLLVREVIGTPAGKSVFLSDRLNTNDAGLLQVLAEMCRVDVCSFLRFYKGRPYVTRLWSPVTMQAVEACVREELTGPGARL